MSSLSQNQLRFPPVAGLSVRGDFDGGAMSSDFGPMILRGVDQQIGLIERLAQAVDDQRHPSYIDHPLRDLFAQRIFQVACGYEDGNDANALRTDPLFKLGVDRHPLARAMDSGQCPHLLPPGERRLDQGYLSHGPSLRRSVHRQLFEGTEADRAGHGPFRGCHLRSTGIELLQPPLPQLLLPAAVSLRGDLGQVHYRGASSRQTPERRRRTP